MNTGTKIRQLRQERGWSQSDLANEVGITQQSLHDIEIGKTRKSRYLSKIAKVLGVSPEYLDPDLAIDVGEGIIIPKVDLMANSDLPVYGSAEGGEGAMIVSVEPVEYVKRPAPLATVREGYGLIIVGSSMEPQYWSGDLALVHPHLPPSAGKAHVFYSDDGNGEQTAIIKFLLRASRSEWFVRQWNPPEGGKRDFVLSRRVWAKCHRIVGVYSQR